MDSETAAAIRDLRQRVNRLETKTTPLYLPGGAWTPTYQGGTISGATTYVFQAGEYTRYGNVVVAKGQINWSAATGTGEARFSLPIAPAGGNGSGSVYLSGITFANNTPVVLMGVGTYFTLTSPLTNAAGGIVQMEAVGSIVFTIVYMV